MPTLGTSDTPWVHLTLCFACMLVGSVSHTACCNVQGINPSAHPQTAAHYLKIYVAFSLSVMLASVLRNIVAVWGSYRASKKMHARLLDHVLLLPMAFFDSQPLGRLLNRFTKDTEAVDVELLKLVSQTAAPPLAPACPLPHPPPSLPLEALRIYLVVITCSSLTQNCSAYSHSVCIMHDHTHVWP